MPKSRKRSKPESSDPYAGMPLEDRPDMIEFVQRIVTEAAQKAIAENDRLGIPSAYSRDGKVHWRMPPKKTRRKRKD